MKVTAHIINHTHWDREWFLTSVYTSQWIPELIDKLEQLVARNPEFRFLLDGQTLIIEDLLRLRPEYLGKIRRLVAGGRLLIGPYYCQPDWRITGGEALYRNLLYGRQDVERLGGQARVGWLVDTFGHISQTPQLHHLFGLDAVFVWRGVPRLEPFFHWRNYHSAPLLTVNLFGGYRNLYGVTQAPEVAIRRLVSEVEKLHPFYPTDDIPLFDGYDLEQNPEDPVRFYREQVTDIPEFIHIQESSPPELVETIRAQLHDFPVISGELNSGKYGAVFPGTLSTRTYLKIMHGDCEHLLFEVCEPLAALASMKGRRRRAEQYERWGRALLQNATHDCICGVSIDQVHEKMEVSYRDVFDGAQEDIRTSLAYILQDFAPGVYAVSTNPFPYEGWHVAGDAIYHLKTKGIGVWSIAIESPVERPHKTVESFEWRNRHYAARVDADGLVHLGKAAVGRLVVSEERGDTYSGERGAWREVCAACGPLQIAEQSAHHCVLCYDVAWERDAIRMEARVRLIFDQSPLVRWQVDLDSRGAGFRVEMVFDTGQTGELYAGMPFDIVKRPPADRDLLPRELEGPLAKVLLGQRELEEVRTFPFHDFVAIAKRDQATVIMARGLRAYQAYEPGVIALTLRRAVEWLTASELEHRAGDAGPAMYVPDARCERAVRHELAVAMVPWTIDDMRIQQLIAGFQNPPILVEAHGAGKQTHWSFLQESLPLSSLSLAGDKVIARFYNPTFKPYSLSKPYRKVEVGEGAATTVATVQAKEIITLEVAEAPADAPEPAREPQAARLIHARAGLAWRVGENKGLPDPKIIQGMQEKITRLEEALTAIEARLEGVEKDDRLILRYRYYVLKRELYELCLSVLLNQRKLEMDGRLDETYLYTPDPKIARLGLELNKLRSKRRIYDYVVEALTQDKSAAGMSSP